MTFTKNEYRAALKRLLDFISSPANREHRDAAVMEILDTGIGLDEFPESLFPLLDGFFALGHVAEDGTCAIDRCIERARVIGAGERAALQAMAEAWCSLFEIVEVTRGVGFVVRDQITNERFPVQEVAATSILRAGDRLFGWLFRVEAHVELSAHAAVVPPRSVAALGDMLVTAGRTAEAKTNADVHAAIARVSGLVAVELADGANTLPTVVTPDGDTLLTSKAHYGVANLMAIRKALAKRNDIEKAAGPLDHYIWLSGQSVRGSIEIEDRVLVLTTMSRERLKQGRAMLERIGKGAIHHRMDTFADPMSSARESREAPPPPTEEQVAVAAAYLRHYYLTEWIAAPIPRLGNKTPRAAVRSKQGRLEVAAMIDEAEHMSVDMPGGDDPALWNELRAALKLPPRE